MLLKPAQVSSNIMIGIRNVKKGETPAAADMLLKISAPPALPFDPLCTKSRYLAADLFHVFHIKRICAIDFYFKSTGQLRKNVKKD